MLLQYIEANNITCTTLQNIFLQPEFTDYSIHFYDLCHCQKYGLQFKKYCETEYHEYCVSTYTINRIFTITIRLILAMLTSL